VSSSTNDQGREASARAAADDTAGAGNLDKVRDILFGVQSREFERRFTRLEERFAKEVSDVKDDVKRRLDALETYARKEAESLTERIKAEHEGRVEATGDLARELKEASKAFEKRTAGLDEQLSKSVRDLRQQLLDQHQRLSEDFRQRVDEVLAVLARDSQELRTDKADRVMLASLLSEMAVRLTDGLTGDDEGDLENG
jgi:DNA anti-recombination protein RmuC